MISSLLFSGLLLVQQLSIGSFDPDLQLKTIETDHFHIHYPTTIEDSAFKLANRVEPIYERITQRFHWAPNSKVHVVISDQTDLTNGLSTPNPYNIIYLYATPPRGEHSSRHL